MQTSGPYPIRLRNLASQVPGVVHTLSIMLKLDVHLLITCLAGAAEDGDAKVSVVRYYWVRPKRM